MIVRAFGQTDRGRVRTRNEDSFLADESCGLFIVADGMGGHAAGDIASKMAVDIVREHIKRLRCGSGWHQSSDTDKFSGGADGIAFAVRLANQTVYESAQDNPSYYGMGTTIDVVLFGKEAIDIAHVGDSRVYLVRDRVIEQLTEDHSLVAERVKIGLLTEEEAEDSEIRNFITRALGSKASVDIDLETVNIQNGDRILLCTDGLTSMVADDVICSIISSADEPSSACSMLIDSANENGGKDNITVVLTYLDKG